MDDVDGDAEAGAEPEQGAGILGDVGLVEGEVDGHGGAVLAAQTGEIRVGIVSQYRRCHVRAGWTSSVDSAKRTPKIRTGCWTGGGRVDCRLRGGGLARMPEQSYMQAVRGYRALATASEHKSDNGAIFSTSRPARSARSAWPAWSGR